MNSHELLRRYSASSEQARLEFLSRLVYELTIDARDTYVPGTEEIADGPRLRRFNEFQHRLLSHLNDVISGEPDRRSDDFLCEYILVGVQELQASRSLRRAVELLSSL